MFKQLRFLPALAPALLSVPLVHGQVTEENQWSAFCPAEGFPVPFEFEPLPEGTRAEDVPASVEGLNASTDEEFLTVEGDVVLTRPGERFTSPRVRLKRSTNVIYSDGPLRIEREGFAVMGSSAEVDMNSREAIIEDARMYVFPMHGRAETPKLLLDAEGKARLRNATLTTCPEGDEFWEVRGKQVDLDRNTGRGEARHAQLRLKDVPVFYFPYVSFPIDDRRYSGVLWPTVGMGTDNGFELAVPYYWNIAPNRDATFTPHFMGKRGLMGTAEFRYLNEDNYGIFEVSYLPDDDDFGDDRSAYSYLHEWIPEAGANFTVQYQEVSDDDYLDDFSNSLQISSASHLERHATFGFQRDFWGARMRAQNYQTVDEDISSIDFPYKRMPQLTFGSVVPDQLLGSSYHFDTEFVYYSHKNSRNPEGGRILVQPGLSYPMHRSFGYLTPKVSLNYRYYDLKDDPEDNDSQDYTIPISSIDSGLFFERQGSFFGNSALHTLEPRLFYLYVPHKGQDKTPSFDSTEIDPDYASLYLENRFTTPERIGDANQLTYGLSTAFFDLNSGFEWLRLSVGQAYNFTNRKIFIKDRKVDRNRSDVISEGRLNLDRTLALTANLHWDTYDDQTSRRSFGVHWNPEYGKLFNVVYRYTAPGDNLEQVDTSFLWPLTENWQTMGRYMHDIEHSETLEALLGFQYEDCCWMFRIAGRAYRSDGASDSSADTSLLMELHLKGMGSLGDKMFSMFKEGIVGYEENALNR